MMMQTCKTLMVGDKDKDDNGWMLSMKVTGCYLVDQDDDDDDDG